MGLADKILALRRSGGLSTDAAATLLGVTRAQAEAELRDPSLADPAPAGGGGGGGGGGLAVPGLQGDPTQVPTFVGFFFNFNDIYEQLDPWTVPWKQGCWAIVGFPDDPSTPGSWAQMAVVVLDADGGDWQRTGGVTGDEVNQLIKQAAPPFFRDVFFPGPLAAGMKRRLRVPHNVKFTDIYMSLGVKGATNTGKNVRIDVVTGYLGGGDGDGQFVSQGSIFGTGLKPVIFAQFPGQASWYWESGNQGVPTTPPLVGGQEQGHVGANGALEVSIWEVPEVEPGADLNVTLVGVKTPY